MHRSRLALHVFSCLVFAAVLSVVSWRTYSLIGVPGPEFDPLTTSMGDFREVVYYPVRAAMDGVNPYDNRRDADPTRYRNRYPVYNVFPLYSPILFPLAAPFALLPYSVAQIAYWAVNVALVLLYAAIALRWAGTGVSLGSVTLLAAAILLSRPGHANLYYGQVTLPVTLATIGALFYARSRPNVSGLLLAIATLKPTFGGPASLLMLARGDRRAAIVGLLVGGIVALGGWSVLFYRDAHRQNPLDVLRNNQSDTAAEPGVRVASTGNRIDVPLVAERLCGPSLQLLWRVVLPIGILAMGGWWVRGLHSQVDTELGSPRPEVDRLGDALILTTTAICVYHNVYDALLLVPPLVWLGALAWRREATPLGRGLPAVAFVAFLVPAVNYFSSHRFLEFFSKAIAWPGLGTPETATWLWTLVSILNGVSLAIGWLVLMAMAGRARRGTR